MYHVSTFKPNFPIVFFFFFHGPIFQQSTPGDGCREERAKSVRAERQKPNGISDPEGRRFTAGGGDPPGFTGGIPIAIVGLWWKIPSDG